ncbi:MAG: response regulator receiver protein [Segetibacter sp.]|nr:response regulator receiver protein [Segetibacter sp.]
MTSLYKHILIADDDEDDVELFQSALDEICPELKVSVASDGAKLIRLLDILQRPDAILLDLNMPYKSGKECLREIRKKDGYNDIPIVILSTSSSKADIDYCLTNGANQYIVKPNSVEGMKNIVRNLCYGNLNSTA